MDERRGFKTIQTTQDGEGGERDARHPSVQLVSQHVENGREDGKQRGLNGHELLVVLAADRMQIDQEAHVEGAVPELPIENALADQCKLASQIKGLQV